MDSDIIVEKLKKNGSVIAIKTDTVYGLISNAYDKEAVKKIYDIKNREKAKPISIFIKDVNELNKYVDEKNLTKEVYDILDKYWPGALTVIFKRKNDDLSHLVCGNKTIGIRVPIDKQLLDILNVVDFPLAETSCNISGEEPYKNANIIKEKFADKIDLIVDGGEIEGGIPSTVIDVTDGSIRILRNGEIQL